MGVFGFSQPGVISAWVDDFADCDCEDGMITPSLPPFWVAIPVLVWLIILSYFDVKTHQVPHIAWVFIPCLAAICYRVLIGEWNLAALAILTILASERRRLPLKWQRVGIPIAILTIIFLVWADGMQMVMMSLAVLGFWLAWELHAWGGADALTAITLVLLWPDMHLLVTILLTHLLVSMSLQIARIIRPKQFVGQYVIPEIPLLMISVTSYVFCSFSHISTFPYSP